LWVTGLSDDAWPLTARPNPFIPAVLQRRAGIPEASAEASLALDRHITEGWLRGATDVVLSHALVEGGEAGGEQARAASALIRHVALSGGIEAPVVARYAEQLQAIGRQEPIVEVGLMPLPVPTSLRGGATVLRDQSACAFRGFARHRLGATPLLAPAGGLDAAERGTLLHRVLNLVWSELKSHTGLISKEADAMHQLVKDAAGKAIREVHDKGAESLAGRFAVIERDRLVRVVVEWLDYERERAPFNVVACEQSRQATLAGLSMTLRLDRLDRLEDGTHAIIDYKTGQARVASWLGERPDEPQLPLYLHTAEQDISTIAYARVKRGERGKVFGFAGVSAVDGLLPDVTPIEQQRGMPDKGYVSWDVLVESWDTALTALANDFTHGVATVDPKHGGLTCAQCDLHGICRIAEWTGHAIAAEDSTGGPAANGADDE
jgi:probable DNA repair protein